MNLSIAAFAVSFSCALAMPVHAQGELGDLPKSPSYLKRSPEQKASGKAKRQVEGRAAIREAPAGELGPQPKIQPAMRYTKDEKTLARSSRKTETARANKAGEISTPGEVGPTN